MGRILHPVRRGPYLFGYINSHVVVLIRHNQLQRTFASYFSPMLHFSTRQMRLRRYIHTTPMYLQVSSYTESANFLQSEKVSNIVRIKYYENELLHRN